MKILLFILFIYCSTCFAQQATTYADGLYTDPSLANSSGIAYDEYDSTRQLHIQFVGPSNPVEVFSGSILHATDITVQNVRVAYGSLDVYADVKGFCPNSLAPFTQWNATDLHIFVDGIELILPPDPPHNTIVPFKGGTVTLNTINTTASTAEVIGIELLFNTGERKLFSHSTVNLECTVPVELQSYEID